MPFSEISLRKLMMILDSSARTQPTKLKNIRSQDNQKYINPEAKPMDFHLPFWSDAKKHILGELDIKESSRQRGVDNRNRSRLYPLLADGFLAWWNEKKRWNNEGYTLVPGKISGIYAVPKTGGSVKVNNLIHLQKVNAENRYIYPYFSEKPILQESTARLGLWLIGQALPMHPVEDVRIIDVLRGRPFSGADMKFVGSEEDEFVNRYTALKKIDDSLEE